MQVPLPSPVEQDNSTPIQHGSDRSGSSPEQASPLPQIMRDENSDDQQSEIDSSIGDVDQNYQEILQALSEKWLLVQLTHNVSAAATNSFWQYVVDFFPALFLAKEKSNVNKNIPGYIHQRRKLYNDICPEIHMKFVYLNRSTGVIETILCNKDPSQKYPKAKYLKLYEEAHINVSLFHFFYKFTNSFIIFHFYIFSLLNSK